MPLIKYEEVEKIIEGLNLQQPDAIEVDAANSAGMILAEDVASGKDIPDSNIAAQDGYAVNIHEGSDYRIMDNGPLASGEAAYIMTGIKLPEGANSVVRIEEVKVIGNRLQLARAPKPWGDVERAGEDVRAGDMLFRRGHLITPYDIPLLIASGFEKVKVFNTCVGIISIGDELAPYNGVRDSIAPMVRALMPFARTRYSVLRDDVEGIKSALVEFSKDCDIILTAGGSSVGKKDLTKKAITETGTLLFEGVQTNVLKRGGLGLVNGKPIVVMPGRIVSAAVVFNAEGLHVLSRLIGTELRRFAQAELGDDIIVKHSMNSTFLFRLSGSIAYPLKWGTGLYSQLARADAFGYLERNREYRKGDKINVQLLWMPGYFLPNILS